jgi:hypothetical protein
MSVFHHNVFSELERDRSSDSFSLRIRVQQALILHFVLDYTISPLRYLQNSLDRKAKLAKKRFWRVLALHHLAHIFARFSLEPLDDHRSVNPVPKGHKWQLLCYLLHRGVLTKDAIRD